MKRLFFLFFISFSFHLKVDGQFLSPPYRVLVDTTNNDLKDYFFEADFFDDGKNEILTATTNDPTRNSIRFLNHKFGVIDALNSNDASGWFNFPFFLKTSEGNILLVGSFSDHQIKILSVKLTPGGIASQKSIYKCYSGNKKPSVEIHYLLTNSNTLIITISTNYPGKHDFRRILAFDRNTLKLLWESYTANYIQNLFYCSNTNPDAFYYTTSSFFNGLHFSNKTFYRTDVETLETFIDTAFTDKHYPVPDVNADDYSTDSCNYLVKMSLKGDIIWKKKLGGSFLIVDPIYTQPKDIQYLRFFSRRASEIQYYLFDPVSDSLSIIDLPYDGYEFKYVSLPLTDTLHIIKSGYIYFYTLNRNKTKFINKFPLDEDVDYIRKVNKYYLGISPHFNYYYDTDFNLLAKSETNLNIGRFVWSEQLGKLIYKRWNKSKIIDFAEQSLYERINNETKRIITWVSVLAAFLMLFFWVITMIISKRKIAERNKELSIRQNELEMATAKLLHSEKLAALGTVAASFAHQLNSPIGAILNSSQRLMRNVKDENLDLILQSAEHCKSVIRRFLIASRTQRDDESTCCEFNEIWDNWRELFKDEFTNYKINFITEFSHSGNRLAISASEFQEILSNILFNARDSIIEADKDEKYIKISTCDNGSFLNIVIEDSGTGFDEKIMDNLFDAFITTKKEGVGTGLGLWITKKLLDKVGGNISISNSADGAIINLDVPYCK